MDAPVWELLSRAIVAIVAWSSFGALIYTLVAMPYAPIRPLLWYLTSVVGFIAVWRLYVLWIGFQSDTDGFYHLHIEPIVRVVGQVQLMLLLTAVGLVAFFHARKVRP